MVKSSTRPIDEGKAGCDQPYTTTNPEVEMRRDEGEPTIGERESRGEKQRSRKHVNNDLTYTRLQ
jgi:hypothetical protein